MSKFESNVSLLYLSQCLKPRLKRQGKEIRRNYLFWRWQCPDDLWDKTKIFAYFIRGRRCWKDATNVKGSRGKQRRWLPLVEFLSLLNKCASDEMLGESLYSYFSGNAEKTASELQNWKICRLNMFPESPAKSYFCDRLNIYKLCGSLVDSTAGYFTSHAVFWQAREASQVTREIWRLDFFKWYDIDISSYTVSFGYQCVLS